MYHKLVFDLELNYLTYDQINKTKWDACINNSINKLIYAESFYLDTITDNWDAIVLNDYEAVMPLIWKKKFGIKYLYQPAFFQQGGIFSSKQLQNEILYAFITTASQHFKFGEFTLNFLNDSLHADGFFTLKKRNNFIYQLGNTYDKIAAAYSTHIKESLKIAEKFQLQYIKSVDYKKAINIYKKLYKERLPDFKNKDYVNFETICNYYLNLNRIIVREVWSNDGNSILACVVLLKDENRLYNLVSSVFPEGKKMQANYFLYDNIFKEFSVANIIFDFEGSDIPGIAYFYKKWATANQQYPFIKWNLLPAPIKLIKR